MPNGKISNGSWKHVVKNSLTALLVLAFAAGFELVERFFKRENFSPFLIITARFIAVALATTDGIAVIVIAIMVVYHHILKTGRAIDEDLNKKGKSKNDK